MTALPLNAWLVPFVAALVAAGLALFILLRPWAEAFHRRVALALGLTALVGAAGSGAVGSFGIGLYESKRIVESYRGTLRVESEVGRGTRVVVELPAVATEGAGRPRE